MGKHSAPRPPRRSLKRPTRRHAALAAAVLVAFSLVGVGGLQLWDRFRATHGTTSATASVGSARELDEREVPLESCRVADDQPRIISLGSLQKKGCIEPVGTTDGQVDAPGNIHVAGWLEGTARPGSTGLAIIDGHSSGRFKDGIFNSIGDFEDGSLFTVTYGDGSVKRFMVTSVELHTAAETMRSLARDARKQKSNLALITCGGDYDSSSHTYDRRVVVLAVNAPDDA